MGSEITLLSLQASRRFFFDTNLIYAFRGRLRGTEPHVNLLQAVRSVANVAVTSKLSTTRARVGQTQIQEQLYTTGRFCTVCLALDAISLRFMLALEVALLLSLQRDPIIAGSGSHMAPVHL